MCARARLARRGERRVRPPSRAPSEITSTEVGGTKPSRGALPLAEPHGERDRVADRGALARRERRERVVREHAVDASAAARRTRASRSRRSPTLYSFGHLREERLGGAARAAASRVGWTSCAVIERETSIASTTVASLRGTLTCACGRATPTISAASATRKSAERHERRRRRARASTRFGSSAGVAKRAAWRRAAPLAHDARARRAAAATTSASSASGAVEAHRRAARGRSRAAAASRPAVESTTCGTPSAESTRATPLRSSAAASREALAQRARCACRRAPAGRSPGRRARARRRSGAPARAGRGSRRRAPRGGQRAASSGLRQSSGPRKSETTTTTPRCRAIAPARASAVAERRRAAAAPRSGSRCSASSRPISPARPWLRRQRRRARGRRTSSTPRRLPRRVATCPIASATPSATSALRRSAVPNCIDGDVSSTSQVTSTRSARLTRTCGSPVRAVTFQSIRRTSSPGTYGRTCASSMPSP